MAVFEAAMYNDQCLTMYCGILRDRPHAAAMNYGSQMRGSCGSLFKSHPLEITTQAPNWREFVELPSSSPLARVRVVACCRPCPVFVGIGWHHVVPIGSADVFILARF